MNSTIHGCRRACHCERSEAISRLTSARDCFATLAMTVVNFGMVNAINREGITVRPALDLISPDRSSANREPSIHSLASRYPVIRAATEALAAPLSPEDCALQSMPDCSPTKWHLAHTSWFFETFILAPTLPHYKPLNPAFRVLFNSYYQAVGEQYSRPRRSLLTRPNLDEVMQYRRHVDEHMNALLEQPWLISHDVEKSIELGLNHEQQHQELILTDIKHLFSFNPLHPVFRERGAEEMTTAAEIGICRFRGA